MRFDSYVEVDVVVVIGVGAGNVGVVDVSMLVVVRGCSDVCVTCC